VRERMNNKSFGVEVEVNALANKNYPVFKRGLKDRRTKPDNWTVQDDASVGAEYVSPIFQDIKKFLREVKTVYALSKEKNRGESEVSTFLPVPFSVKDTGAGHHIHFGTLEGLEFNEAEKLGRLFRPIIPFNIWLNANSVYSINSIDRVTMQNKYRSYRLYLNEYSKPKEVIRVFGADSSNVRDRSENRHYDELNFSLDFNTLEFRSLDANIPQVTGASLCLFLPILEELENLKIPSKFCYSTYKRLRKTAIKKEIPLEFVRSFIPTYFEELGLDVNLKVLPLSVREVLALALVNEKTPFDILLKVLIPLRDTQRRRLLWRYFDLQTKDPFNYLGNLKKLGINVTLPLPKYLVEYLEVEPELESNLWNIKNAYYCLRGNYNLIDKLKTDKTKELKEIIKKIKNSNNLLEIENLELNSKEIYLKVLKPYFKEELKRIKEEKESRKKHGGLYIKIGRLKSFNKEGLKSGDVVNEICKLFNVLLEKDLNFSDILIADNRFYYVFDIDKKESVGVLNFDRVEGEIFDICIMPKYRRKGIGKSLIEMVLNTSEQRPFTYVHKSNRIGLRFFESVGFKRVLKDVDNFLYASRLRKSYSWESLDDFEGRLKRELEILQRNERDELERVLALANRRSLEFLKIKLTMGRVRTTERDLTPRDLNNFIFHECRVCDNGQRRSIKSLRCGLCDTNLSYEGSHRFSRDSAGFYKIFCNHCNNKIGYLYTDKAQNLDHILNRLRQRRRDRRRRRELVRLMREG
jgi:ribosomal protein S18 acetylase RimI-like enzyme